MSVLLFCTPAPYIFKTYCSGSWTYLKKLQDLTKDNLELQWPLWKMFNLDKRIHLQGALDKKGSQPRTHCKGRGEIIFPSVQFLTPQMGSTGTPHLL